METNPYTTVVTARDEVHVVELQGSHGPGVAHQAAVHHAGPEIP